MAHHNINVQINLGAMPGRMLARIQATTHMVAIGLNTRDSIASPLLTMPSQQLHQHFGSLNWTVDQAKTVWEVWVLANGFRDVAEAISWVLEEVQSVLSMWELKETTADASATQGEVWNETVVRRGQRFHRKGLTAKLEFLDKQYGFVLEQPLSSHVMKISAARNCLTHRGGFVTPLDADANGAFSLEWSALVIVVEEGGKEVEIVLPYLAQAGTKLGIKTVPKRREFKIGERVEITSDEFSQICWTMFLLANSCAKQLEDLGKARGLELKTPDARR